MNVLIPREHKSVERLQERSKSSVSIMFRGTAKKKIDSFRSFFINLRHHYNRTENGSLRSIYRNSGSGWFDIKLFEIWFFNTLCPHMQERRVGNEIAVVTSSSNLTCYFSLSLQNCSRKYLFYDFNSKLVSHDATSGRGWLGPVKKHWGKILDKWRKRVFPMLLKRLMRALALNIPNNLQSFFRITGLYAFDPKAVLRKLSAGRSHIYKTNYVHIIVPKVFNIFMQNVSLIKMIWLSTIFVFQLIPCIMNK